MEIEPYKNIQNLTNPNNYDTLVIKIIENITNLSHRMLHSNGIQY